LKALCAVAVAGCAATTPPPAEVRPVGEDPLALLPAGADLLVDVDVRQLRRWQPARRLLALLPEEARMRLSRLGADPLASVDGLLIAVAQAGSAQARATVIVEGDELDLEHARLALGADAADVDYHGVNVSERGDDALAPIGKRRAVLGSRADVRRVIDLLRGEGESVRADHTLCDAFARAPTAKSGRPAVMAALVPSPELRKRLRDDAWPGSTLEWAALSFAVGPGFDVGALVAMPDERAAERLADDARVGLEELRGRMLMKALGIAPYLQNIVVKTRASEVHFAYWLGAAPVDELLGRLESFQAKVSQSR
jgi:hypothetical protein